MMLSKILSPCILSRPACALREDSREVEERMVDVNDTEDEVTVILVVVVRPLARSVQECTLPSAPPQREVPAPPAVWR